MVSSPRAIRATLYPALENARLLDEQPSDVHQESITVKSKRTQQTRPFRTLSLNLLGKDRVNLIDSCRQ
jgi:hypothetical protein